MLHMQGMLLAIRHLALAALILRALLPAGWMPDAQSGLVICAAGTLGVIHHDGPPEHGKTAHEECPFAAAPHVASTPTALHVALPAFHALVAAADRTTARTIAACFTPQSPRAPPAFV